MNITSRPVYHETKQATYFDMEDGVLKVVYKGNYSCPQTVAHLKNNPQGHETLRKLKAHGRKLRVLYRCPKDGRTYDQTNNKAWGRNGWIRKSESLVISVRRA